MENDQKKLDLYTIDLEYVETLEKEANTTQTSTPQKQNRKFIGTIVQQNGRNYIVPMSSPKKKHEKMNNNVDFMKIDDGKLGVINFNNMIPVHLSLCKQVKIKEVEDVKYKRLLQEQFKWLNKPENTEKIIKKANNLYDKYNSGTLNEHVKKRCVDFNKAEKNLKKFMQERKGRGRKKYTGRK